MTQEEKKIKRYVNAIERKLRLPLEMKSRINADLGTDIHARLEQGQNVDEVLSEIGTPQEVAERFNTEMGADSVPRKSPVRFLFGLILFLGISGVIWNFCMWKSAITPISIIGGADGPTSFFIAGTIVVSRWEWILFGLAYFWGLISAYFLAAYGSRGRQKLYKRCVLVSALGIICAAGGWAVTLTHLLPNTLTADMLFAGIRILQLWIPTLLTLATLFISLHFYRLGAPATKDQADAASRD